MTLMEFSIFPLDKGISVSKYVARVLDIVDKSEIDYKLNPMGTVLEGEWEDLLGLLDKCFRALEADSDRIILQIKVDYRKGDANRLSSKLKSVEQKVGRALKT